MKIEHVSGPLVQDIMLPSIFEIRKICLNRTKSLLIVNIISKKR